MAANIGSNVWPVDRPGDGLFFFCRMFLGAVWFVEVASRGSFGWSVLTIAVVATGSLLAYRPARRDAAGALVGGALPVLLQAYGVVVQRRIRANHRSSG